MRMFRAIFLAIIVFSLSAAARADSIVQAVHNGHFQVSVNHNIGQSFTAIQSQVNSISVMAGSAGARGPVTATVNVYSGEGWGGTLVGNSSRTLNLTPEGSFQEFSFSGLNLVVGQQYTFFFNVSDFVSGRFTGDLYSGGRAYFACVPCATTGVYIISDLAFRVDGPATETPEPGTLGLLGTGLAGIWFRRRN